MRALRRVGFTLIGVWAILSIGVLSQFLYELINSADADGFLVGELRVKLVLVLMVLNFPASLVASLLPLPVTGPISEWCTLTMIGLVQWTLLFPMALKKIYARFSSQIATPPLEQEGLAHSPSDIQERDCAGPSQ